MDPLAYFAVAQHDGDGAGWRPFTDLFDGTVLAGRVEVVRATLAARVGTDVDVRACASTHFLALASRLVAPALLGATQGRVERRTPDSLWWQPVDGGPVPLAAHSVGAAVVDTADGAATAIHGLVIATVVTPLVEAFADAFRLSTQVLWGNVASALNGAAVMLRAQPAAVLAPDDVVRAVLATPRLIGAAHYDDAGFVRDNCCLFYRIPGGGLCGDCVRLVREVRLT